MADIKLLLTYIDVIRLVGIGHMLTIVRLLLRHIGHLIYHFNNFKSLFFEFLINTKKIMKLFI